MYDRMNDFNDHHRAFGDGGAWWHILVMVLVVAAIGLAVWFILSKMHRASHGAASTAAQGDPAIATLRKRFARSEITEDEFRSRLALLEGAATPTS